MPQFFLTVYKPSQRSA